MSRTLYDLLDWKSIEDICYGEADNPHDILGMHRVRGGKLIQAYFPDADKVFIEIEGDNKLIEMECPEQGFFATYLTNKVKADKYHYVIQEENVRRVSEDAYNFQPQISIEEIDKFNSGINYNAYDIMGAHIWEADGVSGVLFSVWAPNAVSVSVVGNFNHWHEKANPMRNLWKSGVFELFVPGITSGEMYKFSIACKDGTRVMKSDPYAVMTENTLDKASIVSDLDNYNWTDSKWLEKRKKFDCKTDAMSIYEVHLDTFNKECTDYIQLAEKIAAYVNQCGYTHVLLLPVMESVNTAKGYHTFSNYAPESSLGTTGDFQKFIDYMHKKNIGVILEVSFFGFPLNDSGLACFDGTWLYEHMDKRQGYHPKFDMAIYNYGRKQVTDFLISSAFFWAEKYHIDGLFVHKADSVLYLDYAKTPEQWLPNIYGGNENLDGIEFFKHLNSVFKKNNPDILLIAEDDSGWPLVTTKVEEDGLGFDMKLNYGWNRQILTFMGTDPIFRSGLYNTVSEPMLYQYSENFVLDISHRSTLQSFGCIRTLLPGSEKIQFANLKTLYAYMFMHPGKKLLFMGQDIGSDNVWDFSTPLEWEEFNQDKYEDMKSFIQGLNELYCSNKALHESDNSEDGFMWVNAMNKDENIITFMRSDLSGSEKMLVIANFLPLQYDEHKIGVPYKGKYKEVFNSDALTFGGEGIVNPRVKITKEESADGYNDSITIKIPPMSVLVFRYAGK